MATYKIQVRAGLASDAHGKPYENYCIAEPKSYAVWWKRQNELNEMFPITTAGIPVSQLPMAKPPQKFKGLTLKRGGDPVQLTVGDQWLEHYKKDRNVSIDILETKEDTKKEETKAA